MSLHPFFFTLVTHYTVLAVNNNSSNCEEILSATHGDSRTLETTTLDVMADNSAHNISRSRRRRNRRRNKKNILSTDTCINSEIISEISEDVDDINETIYETNSYDSTTNNTCQKINQGHIISETNTAVCKTNQNNSSMSSKQTENKSRKEKLILEELTYRVESPTPLVKKSPPKTDKKSPVKSRSLDDDDIKITELSETSESEEKFESNAIVAEAESESDMEWEEANEISDSEQANLINNLTLKLEKQNTEQQTLLSPDDELHLRNFLVGLNLIKSRTETATKLLDTKEEMSDFESIKSKKAKKKAELAKYFIPVYQNPRFLDAISEEGSDLSDREQKQDRQSKKVEVNSNKTTLHTVKTQQKSNEYVCEKARLLDTKIIDINNVTHAVCEVGMVERSSGAEVVFLEDSSTDAESEEFADAEEENSETPPIEENKKPVADLDATVATEVKNAEDLTNEGFKHIPFSHLTPPLTPEGDNYKNEKITNTTNMGEFIKNTMVLLSKGSTKDIQTILTDPRYMCLPTDIRNRIIYTVQLDGDKVEEAAEYTNVVTPVPSRSPSACSDSGSSRSTSLCTSKYNPNSSVGDIKSIEENHEISSYPISLRELCLNRLISLPFGAAVLEELADVSRSLQKMTEIHKQSSSTRTKSIPAFMSKSPEKQSNNDSFTIPVNPNSQKNKGSSVSEKWVGMPTDDDPQLLVCVSPNQRYFLDSTKQVPNEAGKLLELHEKFVNRRCYHEEEIKQNSTKRLLAIIRDSSTESKECLTSEDEAPPVPPRPQFNRSLSATLPRLDQIDKNEARLKAQNLSEWLHLARDKSSSETNINMSYPNTFDVHMRPASSMSYMSKKEISSDFSTNRRASLPQALYQRQMDNILKKEWEIQQELKKLEDEKRRLFEEHSSKTKSNEKIIPIKIEHPHQAKDILEETVKPIKIKTVQKANEISNIKHDFPFELSQESRNVTIEKKIKMDKNFRSAPVESEGKNTKAATEAKIIPITIEKGKTEKTDSPKLKDIPFKLDSKFTKTEKIQEEKFEQKTQSSIKIIDGRINESTKDSKFRNIPITIESNSQTIQNDNKKEEGKVSRNIPIQIENGKDVENRKSRDIPITIEADQKQIRIENQKSKTKPEDKNIINIPIKMETNQGQSRNIPITIETSKAQIKSTESNFHNIPIRIENEPHFEPINYYISKQGDIAIHNEAFSSFKNKRPASVSIPPTEFFRQQMYQEYLNQMAERQDRKQQKVIKISSRPPTEEPMPSSIFNEVIHVSGLEDEFMDKVKQRMDKYGLKVEDVASDRKSAEKSDCEQEKEPVLVVEGDSVVKSTKKLPKHLQEFVDITRQAAEITQSDTEDGE